MKKILEKTTTFVILYLMIFNVMAAGVPTQQSGQCGQATTVATNQHCASAPNKNVIVKDKTTINNTQPSQIEKKSSLTLEPMSLEDEIQQQTVRSHLKLFGYEMFAGIATTFAPITGAPVPQDYIIGPGDTFTIQAFSAADVQYTPTVTREGMILVPEVGALSVSGLTFNEAKQVISESIERQRIGIKTVVTLSNLRSIQVMMVGEVAQPGTYAVSGFSTLINTLISSGGIKRTGSLRDIQVKRAGQLIATLDLYKLLLEGDDSANIYMAQGDMIFVPPIGRTVSVAGEVLRPAIYEMGPEQTVEDILKLAGGLLPTAAKTQAQIERVSDAGLYTLLQANLTNKGKKITVQNGDKIRILPVLNKMDDVVLLSGHVLTPGGRQWREGMRISDLIGSISTLRQGAELDVAMIQRENRSDKRTEVIYFNLKDVLTNQSSQRNIRLNPRDQVIIFDTHSARADRLSPVVQKLKQEATADSPVKTVELKGFLRHPGIYPLQAGIRLLDMLNNAGGLEGGVDLNYVLLARTDLTTDQLYFVQLDLHEAMQATNGDHNPVLQAKDKVYLFDKDIDRAALIKSPIERIKRQTQSGEMAPVIQISGSVVHPGAYPMVPGMRIKDLIKAAGGMTEEAYATSATLSRQTLLDDEFSRTNAMLINLTKKDPLLNTTELILNPYDHLVLRIKPEWVNKPKQVTVEGEVVFPGRYRVDKRDTLCSLMQHVGGFTEDAYLFGAIFLRESVRQKEQKALDRVFDQLDQLLAEVHLSPGVKKDQKMPKDQSAKDIHTVLKQLAPEKAQGRMVVDLESAVTQCDEAADIVLEDGDRIIVPKYQDEVSVVGQVYFPTSHKYQSGKGALDYINLSGGTKELAQRKHAYVVQANGAVSSVRSGWGWLPYSSAPITPGSTIYVPLSVDRINGREFTETWIDLFYKTAMGIVSMDILFK